MYSVVIHGQSHKGSSYHIAKMLVEKIGGEYTEFFLPKDFDEFCVGCVTCIKDGETKCPHYTKLIPITQALDKADVIILTSPVYVFHATGQMMSLLDHYAYMWMVHRPKEIMFGKQGVCIATAVGAGTKSTCRDMADSLFFWGVPKVYTYGNNVAAFNWDSLSPVKVKKIEEQMRKLAKKIRKKNGKVKPGFKTKGFFEFVRFLQKKGCFQSDKDYWDERGWTGRERPWHNRKDREHNM